MAYQNELLISGHDCRNNFEISLSKLGMNKLF